MKKRIIFIGAILLLVFVLAAKTLYDAGHFKTITPHSGGSCVTIPGIPGPEDITVDSPAGIAFISSDDRRAAAAGEPVQGAVYALDLNGQRYKPVDLTADFTKEFHPHGISLYKTEKGETLLFVINHTTAGSFVEIFEYRNNRLDHRESIGHPLMFSPNDLVAVGPRRFYATNDHGNASKWGRILEEYLQLARAYVVYFDGNKMEIAAKRFKYANGINTSIDGKRVYVATTIGRSLHVLSRDIPTGALTKEFAIHLNTGADNIERDEEGNLFVACHPKLLDFAAHAKDREAVSPSQVLKISFLDRNQYSIEEVYLDEGKEISASSVAAPYKGGFVIGQVFDGHILFCR
ncbi:MAG: strictosidine synthase family protein [Thermodesulfobacteriota bacterium]